MRTSKYKYSTDEKNSKRAQRFWLFLTPKSFEDLFHAFIDILPFLTPLRSSFICPLRAIVNANSESVFRLSVLFLHVASMPTGTGSVSARQIFKIC